MSVKQIAVSTDFSEESRRAFPAAAALARRFGAELHVIHLAQIPFAAISHWHEVGPYLMPEDYFKAIEEKLARQVEEEAAFQGLKAHPRLVRGELEDELLGFLDAGRIDLLVVSTHGDSGWKRFLLGSFAEKILRSAPCPVLVWKDDREGDAGGGTPGARPASSPEFAPRRLLVPQDFSRGSHAALAVAREWAAAFAAKTRIHFVMEEQASLYEYAAHMEGSFREYQEQVRKKALERLGKIAREMWHGLEVETVVSAGRPAAEILRSAGECGAELIILGTHSKSTVERFFMGSVATKVIRKAPCPVLAVRLLDPGPVR